MSGTRAALLWFGLLGAPAAWVLHLVLGYGLQEADCSAGASHWGLSSHPLEIAVTAVAAAIGLAAACAAGWSWRQVDRGSADPKGRVGFMAFGGIIVSLLFLAIIGVGGVGAVYLHPCTPG